MGKSTSLATLCLAAVAIGFPLRAQEAQPRWFAGAAAGVFALSPDETIDIQSESASSSSYSADLGTGFQLFAGRHLNNYLSLQGSYITHRNRLTIDTVASGNAQGSRTNFAEDLRLHSAIGEVLFYVRPRRRAIRPFLTLGAGSMSSRSARFSDTLPALHFSVGVDLISRKGWAFRYMFNETVARGNPVSRTLDPPGRRNLISFQNVFGIVRHF